MAMFPTLPPEITDRILDFLHNNSSALFRCALTCRSFLPTSLFHMYSNTVYFLTSEKQLAALQAKGLTSCPLSADHRKSLSTLIVSGSNRNGNANWTSRVPLLLPALYPNIHELVLLDFCTKHNGMHARSWGSWRRASWRWKSVVSLRLVRTHFHNLWELQRFVQAFSALSNLRLEGVTYEITSKPRNDELAVVPRSPALSDLALFADDRDLITGISEWLLVGPTKDSLRALTLQLEESKAIPFPKWLDASPENLERLQITLGSVSTWSATDIVPFRLSTCTKLRVLVLDMGYEHAMSLLLSLAPQCLVREVKLDLICEDIVPWEDLNDLFQLPQFSKLEVLDIRCYWSGDEDTLEEEFIQGSEELDFYGFAHGLADSKRVDVRPSIEWPELNDDS